MRIETLEQYLIIRGETDEDLTYKLNRKIAELKGKNPKVTFDGLTAYVKYYESEKIPESLADEYEIAGAEFTCSQCPAFVPRYRGDGRPDRRCKKGGCPISEFKMTYDESPACDALFEMIRKGTVKLCFSE